jgi:hypothetical protein
MVQLRDRRRFLKKALAHRIFDVWQQDFQSNFASQSFVERPVNGRS